MFNLVSPHQALLHGHERPVEGLDLPVQDVVSDDEDGGRGVFGVVQVADELASQVGIANSRLQVALHHCVIELQ